MWYIVKNEAGRMSVTTNKESGEVVYFNTHLHMVRDKLDQLECDGQAT